VIIAVDFDGTVVVQDGRAYDDIDSPLAFLPGAKEGLVALKAAGHTLLLWSARMSAALLIDPSLDPLVRANARRVNTDLWERSQPLNQARCQQMLDFVDRELPGVFAAIDDGAGGKPQVDLFIDDKALRPGYGPGAMNWSRIAYLYGELQPVMQHPR